jgi:hypothetical protein
VLLEAEFVDDLQFVRRQHDLKTFAA